MEHVGRHTITACHHMTHTLPQQSHMVRQQSAGFYLSLQCSSQHRRLSQQCVGHGHTSAHSSTFGLGTCQRRQQTRSAQAPEHTVDVASGRSDTVFTSRAA
jgi:hypothetical protein